MSIVIRIKGGIGNQLFIYAAARRLALYNKKELLIDHISGFDYDREFKRKYQLNNFNIPCRKASYSERLQPFSRIRRVLRRVKNFFISFEKKDYICLNDQYFDNRILNFKSSSNLYLEGYFQSENYFKDVENQIREDLKILTPNNQASKKISNQIKKFKKKSVAVHFRFFDKISNIKNKNIPSLNLPFTYYRNAIKKMETLLPNAYYFIFSDNPKKAKDLMPISNQRFSVVTSQVDNKYAYQDLWLMSQCKHFIIANSTYSWWGAWLAKYNHKIVIAPRLNKNYPHWRDSKLLPKKWIKI